MRILINKWYCCLTLIFRSIDSVHKNVPFMLCIHGLIRLHSIRHCWHIFSSNIWWSFFQVCYLSSKTLRWSGTHYAMFVCDDDNIVLSLCAQTMPYGVCTFAFCYMIFAFRSINLSWFFNASLWQIENTHVCEYAIRAIEWNRDMEWGWGGKRVDYADCVISTHLDDSKVKSKQFTKFFLSCFDCFWLTHSGARTFHICMDVYERECGCLCRRNNLIWCINWKWFFFGRSFLSHTFSPNKSQCR